MFLKILEPCDFSRGRFREDANEKIEKKLIFEREKATIIF